MVVMKRYGLALGILGFGALVLAIWMLGAVGGPQGDPHRVSAAPAFGGPAGQGLDAPSGRPGSDAVRPSSEVRAATAARSPAADRVSLDAGFQLAIRDAAGRPVAAQVRLWAITPGLIAHVEQDVSADAGTIAAVTEEIVGFAEAGLVDFSGRVEGGEYFACIWADGYHAIGRYLTFPLRADERLHVLVPTPPLEVKVVSSDGTPIPNATVAFLSSTVSPEYPSLGWRDRLQASFFRQKRSTDAAGVARLVCPVEGPMTLATQEAPGYSRGLLYGARVGQDNVLVLHPACTVLGTVLQEGGAPVPHGYVAMFAVDESGATVGRGENRVGQDGSYLIGDASTECAALLATAYAEGFACAQQVLYRPLPGREYRVDFVLRKAVEVGFSLVAPDGSPVAGLEVQFQEGPHDWIPGLYTTDSSGRFATAPILVPGSRYLMSCWSGGGFLTDLPVTVPLEEPCELRVELCPLARVQRVVIAGGEALAAEAEVTFTSKSAPGGKPVHWQADQVSPWLPAGPGLLSARLPAGGRAAAEVDLPPGTLPELHIALGAAPLTFELPAAGNGEDWNVILWASGGQVHFEGSMKAGRQRLAVTEGWYSLEAATTGGERIWHGPFHVGAAGSDLGAIAATPLAAIQGSVRDADRAPWPGVLVVAERLDGLLTASTSTDEEGRFRMGDLPPGRYRVRARPFYSLLVPYPDVEITTTLGAGSAPELVLTLEPRHSLQGRVRPLPERSWLAFRLADGYREVAEVSAGGAFVLGCPARREVIGVVSHGGGEVLVAATSVAPGTTTAALDLDSVSRKEVRLLDASGRPAAGCECSWWVGGHELPGFVLSDGSGLVRLGSAGTEDPVLVIRHSAAVLKRIPFTALPGRGDLILSSSAPVEPVAVADCRGLAVSGATVWSEEAALQAVTDARGACRMPGARLGVDLRIEKHGFWPVETRLAPSTLVTLRRRCERLTIEVPGGLGIERVVLEPAFDLGYPWTPEVEPVAGESNTWQAEGLPEGRYGVQALDATGTPVCVDEVECCGGAPVLVRMRKL